ncbi:MAG TPA: adenylate cyclase [Bacteroidales bacterium]|nr:adenylate cyclase [Bacteroidales bacterium]HBZ22275.1 adenylate cyclase [Bacteroidales bacterium]
MAIEIERKFLVRGEFKMYSVRKLEITQGYLSVDPARIIRLRISDKKAILSVKATEKQSGFSRHEWEFEIPFSEASEILKVCLPEVILKTRYLVPFGSHTFEVDVFHGRNEGLIIAEIELKSEDEFFEKPDWLGEEVTGKPEYFNSNLI